MAESRASAVASRNGAVIGAATCVDFRSEPAALQHLHAHKAILIIRKPSLVSNCKTEKKGRTKSQSKLLKVAVLLKLRKIPEGTRQRTEKLRSVGVRLTLSHRLTKNLVAKTPEKNGGKTNSFSGKIIFLRYQNPNFNNNRTFFFFVIPS